MLNAKGRRCDVCARSPLLFFIFILSDVLARFKVIVMNYFGYQVEPYKHIRKKRQAMPVLIHTGPQRRESLRDFPLRLLVEGSAPKPL